MKNLLKKELKDIWNLKRVPKKQNKTKEDILFGLTGDKRLLALKRYYKSLPAYKNKWRFHLIVWRLKHTKIRIKIVRALVLAFTDLLCGKRKRKCGIYQFVALPGEGKTISMVSHMERYIAEMNEQRKKRGLDYIIATNFRYKHQDFQIRHWSDIVRISKECSRKHISSVIALDEIHITFDSSDWKDFPPEMLALLSFNRKFSMQFLCSSQIYDRIPKKIRDIANYTIICKNIWGLDRLFRCYYFRKADYEMQFDGKRKSAQMIRDFVADDEFYSLYDTLEQIDRMVEETKKEKVLKEQAFETLFGNRREDEAEKASASAFPLVSPVDA